MFGLKGNITAKTALAVATVVTAAAMSAVGQSVDPCAQTTKLTSPAKTITQNGQGDLSGSGNTKITYEMWTEGGSGNKLMWYGENKGGGSAFGAEWNNPNDFLGRVGYHWGNGSTYTTYKNIYADYSYTRSGRNTAGDYSYIGIYGWSRNSSASNQKEQLIEFYIVEDWFGNQWQADTGPMGTGTTGGSVIGDITVDGATYDIIKNVRENKPSIDGNKTFTQIFSVRKTVRKCGSISVTEHFKKWENLGLKLGNLYECKFLVEAGGGTGTFDLYYLKFSQEEQPRNGSSNPPPAANGKTLTVTPSPASGGKVTRDPDSASYSTNKSVKITATANSGWKFDGWSGDASGTTNPLTVTMSANKVITAKFVPIPDAATNLVKNGTFTDKSNWTLNTWQNSKGTFAVSGGNANITAITLPSGEGAAVHSLQLVQSGIPLVQGVKYRVSFEASAASARSIGLVIQMPEDPWTTYFSKDTINLTTAKQTFTYDFEMTAATDDSARIGFNFGNATPNVTISNVKLGYAVGDSPTGIASDRRVTSAASVRPVLRAVQSPSGVKVSFKASESGAATLRLYSMKGDVVSSARLQTVSGNSYSRVLRPIAGKLPGGLYMVGLQRRGAMERVSVVVR